MKINLFLLFHTQTHSRLPRLKLAMILVLPRKPALPHNKPRLKKAKMAACAQDSGPLCLLADLKGVGVLVGLPPGALSHLLLPISEDQT